MLLRNDDNEEGRPVTQDTQKVGQDSREMFTASHARHGINDEAEECPEESGDHRERSAQGLDGETGGVGVGDVVCAGKGGGASVPKKQIIRNIIRKHT